MKYPVPEQPTWNIVDPSKLKSFDACKRYYFYRYMLGWTIDEPNIHLEFGEAWHRAMAHLLINGYSAESIHGAYEEFCAHYRKFWSPEQDEINYPKTPINALNAMISYVAEYPDDPRRYETMYVEISGTVPIDARRVLHFRMDSILQDLDHGTKFSFEHKTGSSLYLWEDQWALDVQPTTYNHCLYCLYPEEEVKGITVNGTFFPKKKRDWSADFKRVPCNKSKRQMSDWLWEVNDKYDDLEAEMERLAQCKDSDAIMMCFPKNPGNCINYGKVCEFHDYCCTYSNPLQIADQPPLGFTESHWDPSAQEAKIKMNIGGKENES